MKDETLDKVLSKKNSREKVILATEIGTGKQLILDEESKDTNIKQILIEAKDYLNNGKSGLITVNKSLWFINISLPPLRLVIIGAVHIAQPLAKIASTIGYEVTIIDPRSAFANDKRFPNIKIVNDWPEEALINYKIDDRTAVVTLTHDPKLDDSALNTAIKSKAFYIGSLGSKKTHNSRIKRLLLAKHKQTDIDRIHGPVGLAIGANSPDEIAISIMSEIIKTLHKVKG